MSFDMILSTVLLGIFMIPVLSGIFFFIGISVIDKFFGGGKENE